MKRTLRIAALVALGTATAGLTPPSPNEACAFQIVRIYRGGYYAGGYGREYNGYSGFGYGPYGYGSYEYTPTVSNNYPYLRRATYGGMFPGARARIRYEQGYAPFGYGFYTPYGF